MGQSEKRGPVAQVLRVGCYGDRGSPRSPISVTPNSEYLCNGTSFFRLTHTALMPIVRAGSISWYWLDATWTQGLSLIILRFFKMAICRLVGFHVLGCDYDIESSCEMLEGTGEEVIIHV